MAWKIEQIANEYTRRERVCGVGSAEAFARQVGYRDGLDLLLATSRETGIVWAPSVHDMMAEAA